MLEDGERALSTCIGMRPEALSPRVLLMTNLILQNRWKPCSVRVVLKPPPQPDWVTFRTRRGREREVPLLAIQTLKKTRLQKCLVGCSVEDVDSSVHVVEVNILSESVLLPVSMF